MPITELTSRQRRALEQDTAFLLAVLDTYHETWCENPAEGSRYLACYRLMKLRCELELLMDELSPFPAS